MRRTDAELAAIVTGTIPLTVTRESSMELIREVLEARRRGLTGTVDVMAQAEEGDPVAYKDGLYVAGSGLEVVSWCPDDLAQEAPTQVHLVQDLSAAMHRNIKAIARLKSGVAADRIIAAIYEQRLFVWPRYEGLRVTGVVFK